MKKAGDKRKVAECCNPFGVKHLDYYDVVAVSQKLVDRAKKHKINISTDQYICSKCSRKIYDLRSDFTPPVVPVEVTNQPSTSSEVSASLSSLNVRTTATPMQIDASIGPGSPEKSEKNSEESDDAEEMIDTELLKKCTSELLRVLGLSGIDDSKLRGKKYQIETTQKLMNGLLKNLFPDATISFADYKIIEQLKEKFDQTTSRNMSVKLLSVLPREWTFRQIQEVFGEKATFRMINQTKELVKNNGILCDTKKKLGSKKIDPQVLEKVRKFYNHDDISRPCPGMRECVRKYVEEGESRTVQRRLILMN